MSYLSNLGRGGGGHHHGGGGGWRGGWGGWGGGWGPGGVIPYESSIVDPSYCHDIRGNIVPCPILLPGRPVNGLGATEADKDTAEAKVLPWVGIGLLGIVALAVYNGSKRSR